MNTLPALADHCHECDHELQAQETELCECCLTGDREQYDMERMIAQNAHQALVQESLENIPF